MTNGFDPSNPNPYEPDLSDAKWYIPISSIYRAIVLIWQGVFGKKVEEKGEGKNDVV
jgi:hypothetical protein